MMKITYLGHSGFLAETDDAYFLFDYYKGTMPELDGSKKATDITIITVRVFMDYGACLRKSIISSPGMSRQEQRRFTRSDPVRRQ